MSRNQNIDRWRRPELFLADLINKGVRGDFVEKDDSPRFMFRALVVAVDVYGGRLENPDGEGEVNHDVGGRKISVPANIGPENPKNSIKARILTDEFDQYRSDDDLRVFWPLLSEHDSIPVKPGEHVYVMFEDENFEHGLWIGKVSGHQNKNFALGEERYENDSANRLSNKFDDSRDDNQSTNDVIASGRLISNNKSKLFGD